MNRRLFRVAALSLLACVVLALGGCATRPPATPGAQPAPAPHEHRVVDDRERRPGIGTLWHVNRISWVQPAAFVRANGNRPQAVGTVNYNDLDGVNATLDYLGGEARDATGLQPAGDVSFGLRDGDGRWLKTWALKAWRFAIGEKGRRYEIVLKNNSARPVEVVVTVDGWDVLDGKEGSLSKRGYVLDPRTEYAIEGVRRTDANVSAFLFGEMPETYAQKRFGNTKNVGVIGVAVFREGRGAPAKDEPQPIRPAAPGEAPSSREYAKGLPEA